MLNLDVLGVSNKEILRILPDLVTVISNLDGRKWEVWMNKAGVNKFSNYSGSRCFEVICGRSEPCDDCAVKEVFQSGVPQRKERRFKKEIFDVKIVPLFNNRGAVVGVVETLVDITNTVVRQRKVERSNKKLGKMNEKLKKALLIDPLTKVLNQDGIIKSLDEEIKRSNRSSGKRETFSVLMIDLDDFKSVNDNYGHLAGNRVLTEISSCIKARLRTIDKIGRYGGDEFIVILPLTSIEGARVLAEDIRKSVKNYSFFTTRKETKIVVRVTVSIGVAEYRPMLDLEKILKSVDKLVYKSKREGKNQVAIIEFE